MAARQRKAPIFYGWWVVVAATAVITAQGVMFYGFGILFPSILAEFQQSRAVTSSVYSVHLTTNSLCMLLTGYLIDRYRPRLLIGVGTALVFAGFALSSLTRSIWSLYLFFGVIVGMGTSTLYLPPVTVVTRWFEEKRGLALGIAVTGIGIGGFLGSPFLNWLIQSFGWRTAVLVLGSVIAAGTFLASLVLVGHPREKGLRPYGFREQGPSADALPAGLAAAESTDWPVGRAVRTRVFLNLYLMLFLAEIALLGMMSHLFTYASESGISKDVVSWAYGVMGVASLIGKIGGGALSDRIGRKAAFFLSFALKGAAFILLLLAPNAALLYAFAATMGLAYGGWTPIFPAIVGDLFGLRSLGKIYAVLTTTYLLGGICGPILAGWVFDRSGSYFTAFLIFSVLSFLAAAFSLLLRSPAETVPEPKPQAVLGG